MFNGIICSAATPFNYRQLIKYKLSKYLVSLKPKFVPNKPICQIGFKQIPKPKSSSFCNAVGVQNLFKVNSRTTAGLLFSTGIGLGLCLSSNDSVFAVNIKTNDLVNNADVLYDKCDYQGIYSLLISHKDSNDVEILWRLGRATYERALASSTDPEKKALFKEALNYVEAALALDANHFAVHKWMSILIDYVYAYDGNKARISQSFIIKDHMEKACELKPTDGTSWHIIGLWCYNIADIPWYQRKVASVVFATPPSSSYEDALVHFLHAEKVEPNFYSKNYLFIAKCYLKLGNKSEAKIYLQKTLNYPQKINDDKEAAEEAKLLLDKL